MTLTSEEVIELCQMADGLLESADALERQLAKRRARGDSQDRKTLEWMQEHVTNNRRRAALLRKASAAGLVV